jgi:putative Holliday junction resolvase
MPERLGFGCDVGTKRLGVAVGGAPWTAPRPLASLPLHDGRPPWDAFDRLVRRYTPSFFVFGLAARADGRETPLATAVRRLADEIGSRYGTAVHFVDEAYSTEEARRMGRMDPSRRGAWCDKDATAACIILESWLSGSPPL